MALRTVAHAPRGGASVLSMNGLVFYIGLGLGLALAAGLRPFLPALLAGALAAGGDLGVSFAHSGYEFLQSDWWLLALAAAFAVAWALQLGLGVARVEAGPLGAALAGIGIGIAALLFAGTLGAHGDAGWAGLLGGAAAAALVQLGTRPLLARARARLPDRGAREAVTLYVDATALLLAALVALLHPLGYLALLPFAWLALGTRRRAGEKYAGLRILGR
jgi:hypothetical protein